MNSKANPTCGIDLTEASFHPPLTLRCKTKRFASGVWYYIAIMAFVVGLPAVACLTIERVQHFFAH